MTGLAGSLSLDLGTRHGDRRRTLALLMSATDKQILINPFDRFCFFVCELGEFATPGAR